MIHVISPYSSLTNPPDSEWIFLVLSWDGIANYVTNEIPYVCHWHEIFLLENIIRHSTWYLHNLNLNALSTKFATPGEPSAIPSWHILWSFLIQKTYRWKKSDWCAIIHLMLAETSCSEISKNLANSNNNCHWLTNVNNLSNFGKNTYPITLTLPVRYDILRWLFPL